MRLPPPRGDAAQLLDVQMDQSAGTGVFLTDDLPGGAVEPGKAVDGRAAQDRVDGGAGDAQRPPDAVRSPAEGPAGAAAGCFPQLIGLAGAAPRTAGAVVERIRPAFAGRGGNFGLGPAGQHLGGQLGAGHGGQACVSMAHEGSPVADGLCSPQQFQRGPPPVNKLYVNYS